MSKARLALQLVLDAKERERRRFFAVRRRFYETLWHQTAEAVGATIERQGRRRLMFRRDRRMAVIDRSELMIDSEGTKSMLADKALTYEILAGRGAPVPPHIVIGPGEEDRALDFLAGQKRRLVAKPASGTGAGRGGDHRDRRGKRPPRRNPRGASSCRIAC